MYEVVPNDLDLRAFRKSLGVNQETMAAAMGMPRRTYQEIEDGTTTIRPAHVRAAYFGAICIAAFQGGKDRLPDFLGELTLKASAPAGEQTIDAMEFEPKEGRTPNPVTRL